MGVPTSGASCPQLQPRRGRPYAACDRGHRTTALPLTLKICYIQNDNSNAKDQDLTCVRYRVRPGILQSFQSQGYLDSVTILLGNLPTPSSRNLSSNSIPGAPMFIGSGLVAGAA